MLINNNAKTAVNSIILMVFCFSSKYKGIFLSTVPDFFVWQRYIINLINTTNYPGPVFFNPDIAFFTPYFCFRPLRGPHPDSFFILSYEGPFFADEETNLMIMSADRPTYNYLERYDFLSSIAIPGNGVKLEDSGVFVRFFDFRSTPEGLEQNEQAVENDMLNDDRIEENFCFSYPVFMPSDKQSSDLILLLHGLNERSWNKYLPWAEYLCAKTRKAVVLFPIAYHINRSPSSWTNPRFLQKFIDLRRRLFGNDRSLSVANVALSERLSQNPGRFYESGRQSFADITNLLSGIRAGNHPAFTANTRIDVFAYSIGALLSQVLFLNNPRGLFSEANLYLFCGGSVFDRMYGQSRSIMDKFSFEKLLSFYQTDEWKTEVPDEVRNAFHAMLTERNQQAKRQNFFRNMRNRLGGVSLALDKVIPYQGIVEALGHECASDKLMLLDFPYEYSHENPFPVRTSIPQNLINQSFLKVFDHSVNFFCR
jgi:hypothetical protein